MRRLSLSCMLLLMATIYLTAWQGRPPVRRGGGAAAGDSFPGRRTEAPAGGQTTSGPPTPSIRMEASDRPQDQAPAKPFTGTPAKVEGAVVNLAGEPLKKTEIILRRAQGRDPGFAASTDEGGRFYIADVEPGTYYLSAQRAGYVRQEYGARRSSRQGTALALTEGQEMKGLLIKLTPQGVITGKVLDEDAEPVTRASVQALSQRYLRGKRQLAPAGMAQANDIGEYRLSGLAPGKYILSVTPQRPMDFGLRMRAPRKQEEDAYVTTYYPNVNDGSQALPIDVTAGGEMRGMDFRLHKIKTVHVRGTVIDGADNTPAQNAMVMLAPAGSTIMGAFGRNMAMIREGGAFDIPGVGPGSYSLVVNKMSREGRGASVHQQVNVGNKDLDGLSIVLTPPFTLSGIVRMEGQDKPQFPNARILLDGMDGLTMNTPNATVAADGTFTLQNVSAGQFRINITGLPANSYVKSVKAGNQEALETGADIAGPVPVEIVLSPNAGQITGSVQDAKQQPLSGVTVVLAPDASRRSQYWLFKTAATSQTGGFTLSGIPPGEYTLLSWEDIEDGAYQDPDVVARYESQGKKITIKDGSSETVQVQAIPADGASQN